MRKQGKKEERKGVKEEGKTVREGIRKEGREGTEKK